MSGYGTAVDTEIYVRINNKSFSYSIHVLIQEIITRHNLFFASRNKDC
jgi:hypothetical protein